MVLGTTSSLILVLVLLFTFYTWLKQIFSYWKLQNVPHVPPTSFVGNLKELFLLRVSFGDFFRHLYFTPGFQNEPVMGFYILHKPALLIRDAHLATQILIKEFNSFPNRYEAADRLHDALGSLSLPLAKYSEWRESRRIMSKLFTTGHLKDTMFPRLKRIARDLESYLTEYVNEQTHNQGIIEVKKMCALYTTDVTADFLFGSLRNESAQLRQQCIELFQPSLRKIFDFLVIFFLPHNVGLLRAKVFSHQYANFMRNFVDKLLQQPNKKSNLINLLLQFQKDKHDASFHWVHHPDYIAAQAAIFVLAGFETSSSLMAFILYELANKPQVQEQLRIELKTFLHSPAENKNTAGNMNEISYEKFNSLPLLNMNIAEGLRLYPTAPFINRECLPNGGETHIKLETLEKFPIPRGMPAYISILGIHRDAKYWPDPTTFRPERFSTENLKLIKPMTYLPFGAGPHGCIGSRLGLLQVKLGLAHILKTYRVEICDRTVSNIIFDPKSFMLQARDGIYLKFVRNES